MSQHESTAVVVVPNCVARQCQVATCVALLCCYEFRVRLSFACAAPTAYVNRRPTLAPCPFARLGAIEKMVKPRSPQRPSRAQELKSSRAQEALKLSSGVCAFGLSRGIPPRRAPPAHPETMPRRGNARVPEWPLEMALGHWGPSLPRLDAGPNTVAFGLQEGSREPF